MLKSLQACVPAKTKRAWLLQAAAAGALWVPKIGFIPSSFAPLQHADMLPQSFNLLPYAVGGSLGLLYGAKALELFRAPPRRGIWIGGMFVDEDDLWTSILITGRPSSGKTSGAMAPIAEQIIRMYMGPDYVEKVGEDGEIATAENPHARIGGAIMEVKGEFYEKIAYLLHCCRRNVYTDLYVVRPDSRIPVAQFRDPENGNFFYLNGLPCSSDCDAGLILKQAQEHAKTPEDKRIRPDIFSCLSAEFNAALPALRALKYPVRDPEMCFIGWRRDGSKLVRVSHTPEYGRPEYLLGPDKEKQYVPVPKHLEFVDRVLFSNHLTYNLIDESLPPQDAAEKLTRMAAMSGRGEGDKGSNQYWYNNAQKLIANCIALQRALKPSEAATCAHVYSMVANDKHLHEQTGQLEAVLGRLNSERSKTSDPDKVDEITRRQIDPLIALKNYFAGEWVGLDDKTKGIIKTVVSNTFSHFVQDPALNETFCGRRTFQFAETLQKGVFIAFVPGPQYKNLSKIIGTGLILDFQATALARLERADYNKARPLLNIIDECWNWVIAGGAGGGSAHFLSLCREPRVINLLATQNYNQFYGEIGREAAENYLGCFGVYLWLQNFEKITNDFSERLMELGKKESLRPNEREGRAQMGIEWKEQRLFTAHDFVSLGRDEGIVFNGGRKANMAIKTKLPKSDLTHPRTKKKIAAFMRQYMAGALEHALWKQGRLDRVDPKPRQAPAQPEKAPDAPQFKAPPPAGSKPGDGGTTGGRDARPPVTPQAPAPQTQPPPPPGEPEAQVPQTPAAQDGPTPKAMPRPSGSNRHLRWTHRATPQTEQAEPQRPPEPVPPADPNAATPRQVDEQASEFQAAWRRLVVVAADVVAEDDERGLKKFYRAMTQQRRSGSSPTGSQVTGPNGVSAGDTALSAKASPVTPPSLESLESAERAPIDAKILHHAEQKFIGKSGVPHGSRDWFGETTV